MTNEIYEQQLRALEFADYCLRAVRFLLSYKDDEMIALNRSRFRADINLIIDSLMALKTEFEL